MKRFPSTFLFSCLLAFGFVFQDQARALPLTYADVSVASRRFHPEDASPSFRVKRVVDGDTLLLENGDRVRLIGVDTPESHKSRKLTRDAGRTGRDARTIQSLGKRALLFTDGLVTGKLVRLEYDPSNKVRRHRDRYGRLLAYVYVVERPEQRRILTVRDGIVTDGNQELFLNATIIRSGFGNAYTRYPFKYLEEFRGYEKEARQHGRGLWKEN